MKIAYNNRFLAGTLAIILSTTPSFLGAKVFGYVGLKSGYSSESFLNTTITFPKTNLSHQAKGSSTFGIPAGVDVGFGFNVTPSFGIRIEAEYLYRFGGKFKNDSWKFSNAAAPDIDIKHQAQISNLLGNIYLDYYIGSSAYFYLSGGIGSSLSNTTFTWYNTGDHRSGKTSTLNELSLAWQAGAGLGVFISSNLALDFNVRYVDFGKSKLRGKGELTASGDLSYKAIDALVGFKYRF